MWVSKEKFDAVVEENEKLKKSLKVISDNAVFFGEIVEEAYEEDHDFVGVHTSRMIFPALKRLTLSGFNRILQECGIDKKFDITNNKYIY